MQNGNLIQRMENKLGKYAIKNLIVYILIAYVIGYILIITESKLDLYQYIVLDPAMVMHGQVWRLFTWICTIPQTLSLFVVFMFIFYYFIGKTLERTIGAFKYNLYMFSGWLFMTLGAMIVYWVTGYSLDVSTYYLNLASFLAFALLYPNVQVYFFFILPIKIKWLAYLDIAYLVYQIITFIIALGKSSTINWSMYEGVTEMDYRVMLYAQIFSIVISLLNFIIFFFMVRKITPRNIKDKVKSAQAQRERRNNWNKTWEQARGQWKENDWQSGQTKWEEKKGQEDDPWSRNEQNQDFRDWANWYDPDEDQELRQQRHEEYQQKENQQSAKESRAEKRRRAKTEKYMSQEYAHKCEVCGRTNITDPDLVFRFCSKCDGNHEYCEDHIFNHEHK